MPTSCRTQAASVTVRCIATLSWRGRPSSQRAAAVAGVSAVVLLFSAACSSSGGSGVTPSSTSTSRDGSTGTSASVRRAFLANAAQARKLTSAIERLTVAINGVPTTTGTVKFQRKPTLEVAENISTSAAGTKVRIKAIITATAFYLSEPTLAQHFGKRWIKIPLSALHALARTPMAAILQLVHNLQSNNLSTQAELLTVAKNARVVGTQVLDGVSTTEYAGSFKAADALKSLSPGLRKALAPALKLLGNSTISFHVWLDDQHRLRKFAEVETLNGQVVNTTINLTALNQPVNIKLPPPSQTVTPPGA